MSACELTKKKILEPIKPARTGCIRVTWFVRQAKISGAHNAHRHCVYMTKELCIVHMSTSGVHNAHNVCMWTYKNKLNSRTTRTSQNRLHKSYTSCMSSQNIRCTQCPLSLYIWAKNCVFIHMSISSAHNAHNVCMWKYTTWSLCALNIFACHTNSVALVQPAHNKLVLRYNFFVNSHTKIVGIVCTWSWHVHYTQFFGNIYHVAVAIVCTWYFGLTCKSCNSYAACSGWFNWF